MTNSSASSPAASVATDAPQLTDPQFTDQGLTDSIALGLRVLDDSFARAASRLGDAVPCRRGCSACCVAIFDIHPADALLLGRWLDELAEGSRDEVLARCDEILAAARALAPIADPRGWSPEEGLSALSDESINVLAEGIPLACPVLGPEGECRAYDLRPAICRLQGLPWMDVTSGAVVPDLCRLDDRQAGTQAQPLDFTPVDTGRWEVRDGLAGQLGGSLPRGRTFVAEALRRWQDHDGRGSRKAPGGREADTR